MLKLIYAVSAVALAAGASMPASAQAQKNAAPAAQQQTPTADPNEMICEKQEVLGSRLAAKRVCKTRAQWADTKLEDRQTVEKVQTQRGLPGN